MGEQAAPGRAFELRRVWLIDLFAEEGCMSVPIRDVLVVHPNAGRRAALASALPACRVVAVESKLEATRRLADAAPSLIIAPADDARLFLRQLASTAPDALWVFIYSKSDPAGLTELMQSASEGHVFSVLDDTLSGPELGRTISHLLQHRGSASISLPPNYTVHFGVNGQQFTARALEVGNFGATFQLPIEVPITTFPPGAALRDVSIERDGQCVFRTAWAYVQRAQPVRGSELPHLGLGVSWGSVMHQQPQAPSVTISDPSEVLAMVRKALRRGTLLWLQLADNPSVQIRLESPSVDVVEDIAILQGQGSALLPGTVGEVVHLCFEMSGQGYSGVGGLLVNDPDGKMVVRVPRSLTIRNWRSLPRFKPGPERRFLLSFPASVSGQLTTRPVLDLSVGGLSFPFDASCEILPAGLRIDASLVLPDGTPVPCSLEVRSIQALSSEGREDGGLRPFRAGARFLSLPSIARDAIFKAFISARCTLGQDGALVSFPEVWQLMDQARYRFHPDYPFDVDARVLEQLADTHRKLYSSGDLGRCVVYLGPQGLMGHASGLRIHSGTWLVQHLAVRPTFRRQDPISQELSALLVELGEALEDIEFIRYSWRRDNRWPNRLAGWVARLLHDDQGLSLLRHFSYLRLPLDSAPPAPEGLPPVRCGGPADFIWLEAHLRERGELVRVLSEDLQASKVELKELSERFRAHGLHRRRRVFLVDGEREPLALALAEEGSPGLNLIEKTNSFTLIVPDPAHPHAREAVRAVIQRCVDHARDMGRPAAIALAEQEQVPWLLEAGFVNLGRFSEWIFHRSMIRGWCELVKSLFDRLLRVPEEGWDGPAEEG
jgi:hypothetical protein